MIFSRITNYISFFFSYRRKVFALRKKYDRTREMVDKSRNRDKRLRALKILDQIEPTLVIIEEQQVSRFERMRMFGYVDSGIREASKALKEEQRVAVMQPNYRK